MEKNKLILPISIIIGAIILGWFFYATENNKQKSIEKQAQMKIEQENKILEEQKQKEADVKNEEELNKAMLDSCIADAENAYWNYVELNGTGKRNDATGVTASTNIWNTAKENKKDEIDNCYNRYTK